MRFWLPLRIASGSSVLARHPRHHAILLHNQGRHFSLTAAAVSLCYRLKVGVEKTQRGCLIGKAAHPSCPVVTVASLTPMCCLCSAGWPLPVTWGPACWRLSPFPRFQARSDRWADSCQKTHWGPMWTAGGLVGTLVPAHQGGDSKDGLFLL